MDQYTDQDSDPPRSVSDPPRSAPKNGGSRGGFGSPTIIAGRIWIRPIRPDPPHCHHYLFLAIKAILIDLLHCP